MQLEKSSISELPKEIIERKQRNAVPTLRVLCCLLVLLLQQLQLGKALSVPVRVRSCDTMRSNASKLFLSSATRSIRVFGTSPIITTSTTTTTSNFGSRKRSSSSSASFGRPLSAVPESASTTVAMGGAATKTNQDDTTEMSPQHAAAAAAAAGKTYTLYEQMVRRLYMTNLFQPVKLGLDNIEQLHEALGSPMDNPDIAVIHIAGTNGKGSVAMKTAKTLEFAGHRTGLFVSPHVSSFRERMSVNGVAISEDEVSRLLPRVFRVCEERAIPATFFEITTALAFLFYHERNVDAVVLETGLGGRLDSTNVIKHPALTIITSIGLEHTRILGDTIEEIALEKGGIMKRGRPVIVGPEVPHDVLRRCAVEKGASSYQTCDEILGEGGAAAPFSSNGTVEKDYDLENARIAKAAVHILMQEKEKYANNKKDGPSYALRPITNEHMELGTSFRPPCRFERVDVVVDEAGVIRHRLRDDASSPPSQDTDTVVTVILDVAHNPPAMAHLTSKLDASFDAAVPKRYVAGFSSDKDLALCASHLLRSCRDDARRIHLIQAAHPRAASLEAIVEAAPELREARFTLEGDRSITAQIRDAVRLAAKNGELLVVCGSVFIMSEAREILGFDEPRDSAYIAEMAGAGLRHGQENFGDSNPLSVVENNNTRT